MNFTIMREESPQSKAKKVVYSCMFSRKPLQLELCDFCHEVQHLLSENIKEQAIELQQSATKTRLLLGYYSYYSNWPL